MANPLTSEFEGKSTKSGETNHPVSEMTASEKARIMRRAEVDPDSQEVNLETLHSHWRDGGIPQWTSPDKWWEI
jgi:hypothetical protein